MSASAVEVHHRVPRCLLGFFDQAASDELDGEGLQAWFEWEEEAFRYGVDPDACRGELAALIEVSAVEISEDQHKASHSAAGDFVRSGRLGGLETPENDGGSLTAAPFYSSFAYIVSLHCLHYALG
jgi:hypothetical protein